MFTRSRYQFGWLELRKRKGGRAFGSGVTDPLILVAIGTRMRSSSEMLSSTRPRPLLGKLRKDYVSASTVRIRVPK